LEDYIDIYSNSAVMNVLTGLIARNQHALQKVKNVH